MLNILEIYIFLFFIYSFAGWFMESVGGILNVKKFVNRGFLIGPYCPVYGIGVILVTITLQNYTNDIIALFVLSTVICGILEYSTSYIMEKLFNARWWDYHNKKFNINGRICLETLIPFGIVATLILKYANPFFISIYNKIPNLIIHITLGILVTLFIIDLIISFIIILSFKGQINKNGDNTEEIGNMVKDKTEDVLMKAESDVRLFGRKLKLNKILFERKVKYTGKRISGTILKTPKLLVDKAYNTKNEIINKIALEKGKVDESIKLKRAEFELKQKETKQIISEAFDDKKLKIKNFEKKSKEKLEEKVKVLKNSSEEFTNKIIQEFKNKSILKKRLMDAFPSLEITKKKKKDKKLEK